MICSAFECIGDSLASAETQKTNGIARLLSSILAIIIIIIFQCNFINYSRDYHVLSSTRALASTCAGVVCWLPVAFHVLNVIRKCAVIIWFESRSFLHFFSLFWYGWNLMRAIICLSRSYALSIRRWSSSHACESFGRIFIIGLDSHFTIIAPLDIPSIHRWVQ